MPSCATPPPKAAPPEGQVAYVTDNEQDAEVLYRQTGSTVIIRRWILEEFPYRPPTAGPGSPLRTPRRLKRPGA